MTSLFGRYKDEIVPKLQEEFNLGNSLSLPTIEKIVLNMGLAEALSNKDVLEKAKEQLATIAGQRPVVRKARKSISSFKLIEGDPIGVMVTLRGKRAWQFLEKFIAIVIPRVRDFRGLLLSKFDQSGNYSLGLTEQIIFPEVDYSKIDKARGLVVTIAVKNSNKQKSHRLFELLGIPFSKN